MTNISMVTINAAGTIWTCRFAIAAAAPAPYASLRGIRMTRLCCPLCQPEVTPVERVGTGGKRRSALGRQLHFPKDGVVTRIAFEVLQKWIALYF